MNYIVMHDLDSPKVKRKEKWIKNSMWTINEKIFSEAQKGKNNKVVVNIPDFEGQFFGYLQSGDKPYNAICELKNDKNQDAYKELEKIGKAEIEPSFKRLILKNSDYETLGKKYCEENQINQDEKWDFYFEQDTSAGSVK